MQKIVTITIPAAWKSCSENDNYDAELEARTADLNAVSAKGYKLFSTNSVTVSDVGYMLYTLVKEE